jgi:hypothetical protein
MDLVYIEKGWFLGQLRVGFSIDFLLSRTTLSVKFSVVWIWSVSKKGDFLGQPGSPLPLASDRLSVQFSVVWIWSVMKKGDFWANCGLASRLIFIGTD